MDNTVKIKVMTPEDAEQICLWRYEKPYTNYQWESWHVMQEQACEFGDPQIREQQYRSLYIFEQLIGFTQLFPLINTIRIALFLSPQHCNQGLGKLALAAIIEQAQSLYPHYEIDLEVECWNQRAINCYLKSGFVITDQYSYMHQGKLKEVYCMVFEP